MDQAALDLHHGDQHREAESERKHDAGGGRARPADRGQGKAEGTTAGTRPAPARKTPQAHRQKLEQGERQQSRGDEAEGELDIAGGDHGQGGERDADDRHREDIAAAELAELGRDRPESWAGFTRIAWNSEGSEKASAVSRPKPAGEGERLPIEPRDEMEIESREQALGHIGRRRADDQAEHGPDQPPCAGSAGCAE